MTMDGTTLAGRIEGTLKDRNIVTTRSSPPILLRVAAGYGGEAQCRVMMKEAIFSGEFDGMIDEYQWEHSLRSLEKSICTVEFITAQNSTQNDRELTGK